MMALMKFIKTWEISEALWERVAPLIPKRKREKGRRYRRRLGGGRKPVEARKIFEGIVYVLRTGCQWKALSKEQFGCASSVHRYFLEWKRTGFFVKLWRKGLAEYDDMKGIAWTWQSIDGAMVKSPMGNEAVGSNPTDRGKKWDEAKSSRGREWNPFVPMRVRGKQA